MFCSEPPGWAWVLCGPKKRLSFPEFEQSRQEQKATHCPSSHQLPWVYPCGAWCEVPSSEASRRAAGTEHQRPAAPPEQRTAPTSLGSLNGSLPRAPTGPSGNKMLPRPLACVTTALPQRSQMQSRLITVGEFLAQSTEKVPSKRPWSEMKGSLRPPVDWDS